MEKKIEMSSVNMNKLNTTQKQKKIKVHPLNFQKVFN